MKVYKTNEIRNISLIGGAKTGKTTLSEALLFEGGVINRRGSVDDKNTISDYRAIELERQNSIVATLLYSEFNGHKINIIDTPGYDDFIGEVVTALNVTDTSFMLINAQNGVEVGAEIHWRQTTAAKTPVVFLVNQLEHEKSNFDETITQLKTQFGNNVTIFQYPLSIGAGFNAIIDVLNQKMYKYSAGGGKAEILDIPADQKDKVESMRNALIEAAAENDESLMEKFFEEGTLSEDEINQGLKLGIMNRGMYPVLCVSAKNNFGIDSLLNFVIKYVPAPNETQGRKTKEGEALTCKSDGATSALIFKTSIEEHLGEISFFKVFAGEISEGMDMVNGVTSSKERIAQLFVIAGKKREKVDKVFAGDLCSTIKLKNSKTNTTINSLKNASNVIEPIVYPDPKIMMAIRPLNTADDEKLGGALSEIQRVDPTITVEYSKELKQIIMRGMGELHLNIAKWHIENIDKIPVEYYTPKIPYRETITKSAKASYRHKKQSGGSGQFGEVHMLIQPWSEGMTLQNEFPIRGTEEHNLPWGGKLVYNNCIVGGSIDARFMPAILKGIMEKIEEGPLTGSYARDIVVNIYDGKMHPVDSNELAFKLAGRNAFKEAFKNAGPKILEPIYDVEVMVPSDRMGDIMTDLQGRRAIIMGMDSEGNYQIVKAKVPLAEMNRYSTALSSLTSGSGTYSLKFSEYAQVPSDVQNELLKKYEEEQEDDD